MTGAYVPRSSPNGILRTSAAAASASPLCRNARWSCSGTVIATGLLLGVLQVKAGVQLLRFVMNPKLAKFVTGVLTDAAAMLSITLVNSGSGKVSCC